MEANHVAAFGYGLSLVIYGLLAVLLFRWKGSNHSHVLALATAAICLWSLELLLRSFGLAVSPIVTVLLECLRSIVWLVVVVVIFLEFEREAGAHLPSKWFLAAAAAVAAAPVAYYLLSSSDAPSTLVTVSAGYLLATPILVITEQIYRNAPVDSRSGLSYFCIAVAGIFLYDFTLYVGEIAGLRPWPALANARGYVAAMFAAPLALGLWRMFRLSLDVQFPRQIVFYSFGLSILAVYVTLVVTGHNYIRTFDGSWTEVAGIVLIVAAAASATVVLASASTRARVRVFLMKTFFQFKYDYRKEWLRFIGTLSDSGLDSVAETSIRAIAQIVNSPGGAVWIQEQENADYTPAGVWRCDLPDVATVSAKSSLARFLEERQWVIDLEEMGRRPERYEGLAIDDWLSLHSGWWLILPMFLGKRLYGFVGLKRPNSVPRLNFEDHDLLRTVGRHVGTHINQAESDRRLAESGQFGAYNRLTAFLMHDLNNLIAQLSLVVKNAERHRQNPAFVDDAISTIANSVERMHRLMGQLTRGSKEPAQRRTDLRDAVVEAVERCQTLQPVPSLNVFDKPIMVMADPERLTTVFEHLIRNAQDATGSKGRIDVGIRLANGGAEVSIADTGIGMSPEFIRERLFRPFDSTKGSGSMGVGAYQARDYVRSLGGRLEVRSQVASGTTFHIGLPLDNS